MQATHPFGKSRLAAAIIVSLSLHALMLVGWLHGRTTGPVAGSEFSVQVDGPNDLDLPAFTLLEPRVEAKPQLEKRAPVPPITEPPRLPAEVQHPAATAVETASHSDPSPQPPGSLTKFAGAQPLHGKLQKAGKTIVYILDRSASMGPDELLGRAIAALNASLALLGPDGRFQIVAYNGGTDAFAREPVAATPANILRASEWLKELTAEGRSDHRAGFREALACRPDALFLLTDADDLEEADIRGIRQLMRTPVYLKATVFGSSRPVAGTPLERLTAELGGRVEYPMASRQR